MKNLTKNKFSEEQIKALIALKSEPGWGIVNELAKVVLKDTNLENVDTKLCADEYKIECLAYKKAKDMFRQIFSDVETITEIHSKKKVDYS